MKASNVLLNWKNETGIALIELMIATLIGSVIGVACVTTISQIFHVSGDNITRMSAIEQLDNTLYWIGRDAQMAQEARPEPTSTSGFPLKLSWVDWENNKNTVTYSLDGRQIVRSKKLNDAPPTVLVPARDVDLDTNKTFCTYADGMLNVTLSITSSQGASVSSETKLITTNPRPIS